MPAPLSKRARRENRRKWSQAERALRRDAMRPPGIGLVEAAEMAVEEQAAHRERQERPRQERKRAQQTPMQRYLAHEVVTQQQFQDADRLWRDYMASGLNPTSVGSYGASTGSSGQPMPGCGPRYPQYAAAMRAMGMILSPVVAWVVLEGKPADQWAQQANKPGREGAIILRVALDVLGAHYRGERRATQEFMIRDD